MKRKYNYLIAATLLCATPSCLQADVADSVNLLETNAGVSRLYLDTSFLEVEGVTGGKLKFNPSTGTIVEAETTITTAYIPETINGIPVIAIASNAFENCTQLTEVTLPETVKSIGSYAFKNTALQKIFIPKSVTYVPSNAFYQSYALEFIFYGGHSINLGISTAEKYYRLTRISDNYRWPAATTPVVIVTPSQVRCVVNAQLATIPGIEGGKVIYGNATTFYADRRMAIFTDQIEIFDVQNTVTSASIPANIDGKPVTQIMTPAFEDATLLESVAFPSTLAYINSTLFKNAPALQTIAFTKAPNRLVSNFLDGADNLNTIYFNGSTSDWDCFNIDLSSNDTLEIIHTLSPEWFFIRDIEGGPIRFDIDSGTVLDSADYVGFAIDIPEEISGAAVKVIGEGSFENRINIKSAKIPDTVTAIKSHAFRNSTIATISIPASVTEIAKNTFANCNYLKTIYFGGSKEEWDNLDVDISNQVEVLFQNIGPIWINVNGVEGGRIKFDAASGTITDADNTITIANIPAVIDGFLVKTIGKGAFEGQPFAKQNAFTVILPSTVTSIEENAFRFSGLQSIFIPTSVTSIHNSNYDGIIEPGIFGDCLNLTDIYYGGTESTWQNFKLYVPNSIDVHFTI